MACRIITGFIVFISIFIFPASNIAETVSRKQAEEVAHSFFNAASGYVTASPKMVYNGRNLTTSHLFPPFYVFNSPSGGFVIISAENKAYPILAYSFKDSFSAGNIPASLSALLAMYASHIENIRYDSSWTQEAVNAWNNIPEYISSLISAPYNATDILIPDTEINERLQFTLNSSDYDRYLSEIYSPQQWSDIVNEQLEKQKNVILGIITKRDVVPVILQGKRGEMYRISFPGLPSGLYRIFPTEIISTGEIAVLDNPPAATKTEDYLPFEFYESFMSEIEEERKMAEHETQLKLGIIQDGVDVLPNGNGHFSIKVPGKSVSAMIYNVAGYLVKKHLYNNTELAHIDLSGLPVGFYFATIITDTGERFGVKLYK